VLDAIVAERGQPQAIRCDNGSELTSRHFLAWCAERQIELVHIQPGKPMQNAVCRKLSRTVAGRVFGGELVSESVRCSSQNRGLANRVQRTTASQQFGLFDTEGICYTDEGGFARLRFAGSAGRTRKSDANFV